MEWKSKKYQAGMTGGELVIAIVIAIIVLLILLALVDPFGGGSFQSATISPTASTKAVGESEYYTVTVNLDAPAGPSSVDQVLYAFSGSLPPGEVVNVDLVEADTGWDDVLYDNREVVVPWGQTNQVTVFEVTCVTTETVRGDALSDQEPSQQIRAEINLLSWESNEATLTCTEAIEEDDDEEDSGSSGSVDCDGRDCSHTETDTITVAAPCPPCEWPSENAQVIYGVRLVEQAALSAANSTCGEDCRCATSGSSTSIENCRIEDNSCRIDVVVALQGVCRAR